MTQGPSFPGAMWLAGTGEPILLARSVTKRYPGVTALDAVTFGVSAGEVRALVGMNGAGKSTLIRVLSGAERPDEGHVLVNGVRADMTKPDDATRRGIVTVFQELAIVPTLSVAENVVLGRWPRRGILRSVDWRAVRAVALRAIEELEQTIDVGVDAGTLSLAGRQIVEIARAISRQARVLILDEPTSSLSITEVEALHRLVRRLRDQGVAVIYVSHRLDELQGIADTVTIMRDGLIVKTLPIADAPIERIAQLMMGQEISLVTQARESKPTAIERGTPLLVVEHLRMPPKLEDISFAVAAGEVIGIAGVLGSGRTELLRCLAGDLRPVSGRVSIDGVAQGAGSVQGRIAAGVALAPEDRRRDGLVPILSVGENLVLASFGLVAPRGVISPRLSARLSRASIDRLGIKIASGREEVRTLSGGNQQKVVIGKWLNGRTRVLLLDEPTRGIDVHAKTQIFRIVRALANDGISVLFVSEELAELPEVCDRILVLRRGRITAEVEPHSTTAAALLNMASGVAAPRTERSS